MLDEGLIELAQLGSQFVTMLSDGLVACRPVRHRLGGNSLVEVLLQAGNKVFKRVAVNSASSTAARALCAFGVASGVQCLLPGLGRFRVGFDDGLFDFMAELENLLRRKVRVGQSRRSASL